MEIKVYKSEDRTEYYEKDLYLVECSDRDTYDKVDIGGVEIQLSVEYQKNGLHKYPVRGIIIDSSQGSQFSKGDSIICRYSTFVDPSYGEDKAAVTDGDNKYYTVRNREIICSYNKDGNMTPREGILICEPIYGNRVDTKLELNGELKGRRRDIVKVIKTFKGSKAIPGDYVLTSFGGDYEFYNNGKLYIAVDEYFEDYYAIVKDSEWYDGGKVRKEMDLTETIRI